MDQGSGSNRVIALDFYRFVAAFGVVLYHISEFANYSRTTGFGYWTSYFGLFVDFFFILSGFVIGIGYSNKVRTFPEILVFLRRRIARVYPLYLVTMLCFVGLFVVGLSSHPEYYTASAIASQLLMVQQWQINAPLPFNFPAWSISAEWAMYLLFPLLILLSQRAGKWTFVLIAAASCVLIEYLLQSGEMRQPVWNALRALPTFSIGLLISQASPKFRIENGEGLGFCVFVTSVLSMLLHLDPLITIALFCAAIFLTSRDTKPRSLFGSQIFETLGDGSYSLYMLHAIAFTIVYKGIWPHLSHEPIQLFIGLLLALILIPVSIASFYIFEMPARKLLTGRTKFLAKASIEAA